MLRPETIKLPEEIIGNMLFNIISICYMPYKRDKTATLLNELSLSLTSHGQICICCCLHNQDSKDRHFTDNILIFALLLKNAQLLQINFF